MRVIDLVIKDLTELVRDWKSALYLIAMPVVFTLFFGAIFSGSSGDQRLALGLLDQDRGGVLSQQLATWLGASGIVRPESLEDVSVADAAQRVADGKLAGVIVIPAGYSDAVLSGEQPALQLVVDSYSDSGQTVRAQMQAMLLRLLGSVEIARLSADAREQYKAFASEEERMAYQVEALVLAAQAWQQPPLNIESVSATQASSEESSQVASGYAQSSPGMIIQFAIYGLITTGSLLVLERRTGTLQRLLTTPLTRGQVVLGKVLGMFIVVLVQQIVLVAFGQIVFGVDYMREPLALLVVMATLALWAASLGLLIGAVSKSEESVIVWSLLAMFLLSAMGGAWFPLEITGKTFSMIGHLLPTAWAMDAYQNLVLRGLGLASVGVPVIVLLGYTAVFFGLAVWRLRFA